MAGETFNLGFEVGATIKGVEDLEALVSGLAEVRSELGGDTPKSVRNFQTSLEKVGVAAREARRALDDAAGSGGDDAWDAKIQQVKDLTERLRELAQQEVLSGGFNPMGAALGGTNAEEMREIIAILEAQGVSAESVASRWKAAEREKESAAKKAAEETRRANESIASSQEQLTKIRQESLLIGKSEIEQAQARLSVARQELSVASGRVGGTANDPAKQAEAYRNLVSAQREFGSAKAALNSAELRAEERLNRALDARAKSNDRAHLQQQQRLTANGQLRVKQDAEMSAALRSLETRQASAARAEADRENKRHNERMANLMKEAKAVGYDVGAAAADGKSSSRMFTEIEQISAANRAAAQAADQHAVALPRLRYALYDVATTAGVMQASIGAAGAAVLAASANYERSFTNVERTTLASKEATQELRGELMGLTREIPEAWGKITDIAATGAQLNIAEQDLASFTETTTKFSTVTGVAAETSAMAFGSIGQLLGVTAAEYENMGSAIAYVGVNSIATDAEIVTMAQRLAASAENAGMTAQEVIALSGALASLRVAPERAQGVMEVYFRTLNTAIAEGGEQLNAFAKYSDMSASSVREMVESDPASYFRELAVGLEGLDPVSKTLALEELGLSGIRAGEVFTRVSNNVEVFDKALADSNSAWADGSHLATAYGLVVDDLASKWQIFLNGVMEAGSAVGDVLAPAAKIALDVITPMLQRLAEVAKTPLGKWAIGLVAVLGGVSFALLGIVSTGALAAASIAAVGTAAKELGFSSATGIFGLRGMSAAFTQVAAAAGLSAKSISAIRGALVASGIGIAIVAVGMLADAFLNASTSAEGTFNKYVGSAAGMTSALQADYEAFQAARAAGDSAAVASYTRLTDAQGIAIDKSDEHAESMRSAAEMLGVDVKGATDATTESIEDQTVVLGENSYAWLENALVRSEEFQKIASNEEFVAAWQRAGLSMRDVINAAAANGEAGVYDLFARLAIATDNSAGIYLNGLEALIVRIADSFNRIAAAVRQGIDNIFNMKGGGLHTMGASFFAPLTQELQKVWSEPVFTKQVRELAKLSADTRNEVALAGSAGRQAGLDLREGAGGAEDFGKKLGGAGGAAKEAAQEFRTVKDYASDLAKVWDRAFEIRFGGEQSMDKITSAWTKIATEIDNAKDAIRKYKAELQTLGADKYSLQQGLMVAENYGDYERAKSIRAKLAELEAKEVELKKKLSAEQEKSNKTLRGNSETAIENRKEILGLVGSYQSHIKALAESGLSSEELKRRTADLKAQFIAQATQLGYNRTEVMRYAASFDDVATAIRKVPRNVSVEVKGVNPAIAALREIEGAARKATKEAGNLKGALGSLGGAGGIDTSNLSASLVRWSELAKIMGQIRRTEYEMKHAPVTNYQYMRQLELRLQSLQSRAGSLRGWEGGGYTGNIPTNQVAGAVHGQEFVFSAPAVRNIGLGNLAYMHSAAKAGRNVAPNAFPKSMMVELSPYDRDLLRRAAEGGGVSLSGNALQRFAGAGALNSGRTGQG